MIRLFIDAPLLRGAIIYPSEKQQHYLLNVMRLQKGDCLFVFNGKEGEWKANVEMEGKKKLFLSLEKRVREQSFLKECFLCPALIKKENMDLVLQKATELGVTDIFPVLTQRTVVRQFNTERAQAIVIEASEQCERLTIPVIHAPISLFDLPQELPNKCQLVFLSERGKTSDTPFSQSPAFLIGPEGGFSPEETLWLEQKPNVISLHLGETILRAETAAIAVLACWQFRDF